MGMFWGPTKAEMEKKDKELRANVTMTEHLTDLDELMATFQTNLTTGLAVAVVTEHLAKYGKNELTPPPQTPWYVKFIGEMTGLFSMLLWLAGAACFVSYALVPDPENLYLGIVLCVVVFATGCFSYFQNRKSDNMMAEFKAMRPPKVNVIRSGEQMEVDALLLTIGDVVLLEAGDLVPADIRICECSPTMSVNNSSLTGESEPVKRTVENTTVAMFEATNLAFFGTEVPEGTAKGIVVKVGDETAIGRIASLALRTKPEQTPINKEIHHFITIISVIAIALGVSFFGASLGRGQDVVTSLVFMIGIIVANVPEGLLVTVTVCLSLTAKRMFHKSVKVKNLEGVETLGSTSCICSDKTGTLTQNIMTVAQMVYFDNTDTPAIQDAASSFSKGIRTYDPASPAFLALLKCSLLCNTCYFNKYFVDEKTEKKVLLPFKKTRQQGDGSSIEEIMWKPVGSATEGAMIKFGHSACQESLGLKDIEDVRKGNAKMQFEIPFNSKNKYQVHVHCQSADESTDTRDRVVYIKGAPERIFARCTEYVKADGSVGAMTPELMEHIISLQDSMGNDGLRVLGFARKVLPYAQYPANYAFSDGSSEGFSTANFPLGEFDALECFDQCKALGVPYTSDALALHAKCKLGGVAFVGNHADASKVLDPPHPLSKGGLCFLGMMALIDPPREAVPGAVAKCKTAGIKVIMVTGDHPGTAKAIAHKVGILWSPDGDDIKKSNVTHRLVPGDQGYVDPASAQAIVVPGWTISDDDPLEKWDAILAHPQIVFARTSPQQKLVIVSHCQRQGHIVAVTGDGVNDSPALKKADIGIAMGIAGTPVTKNAADMILLDDNFASIVAGVEEGRLIFDNLKKSICYTLTSNIPEISPFLCWITLATPMPLSTVLILAIDLGTDMIPAISMAYEDAEADIMKRPPRNAKIDRLVTRKLIFLAYLQIGIMQAMAGFYAWMLVLNDYGYPPTVLVGNPSGTGLFFGDQTMYCKFNGGQYVNSAGEIDPTDPDPSLVGPSVEYPLWDRGDAGYLKSCTFAAKMVNKRRGDPGNEFNYQEASTYDTSPINFPQTTVEAIWALEAKGFFEYTPWRARMSPFWNNKWVSWDISKTELKLAGAKAGTLGWNNNRNARREGKADYNFVFNKQMPGLWSNCIANNYTLTGRKRRTHTIKYAGVKTGADGFVPDEDVQLSGATFGSKFAAYSPNGGCEGSLNGKKWFNHAQFCNGGYDAVTGLAEGDPACAALDDETQNLHYCAGGCGCDAAGLVYGASRANANVSKCMNIASRMSQEKANSHAQAAYWVSIVVVQWADLLICKTRWLSIQQQGLRNSVLNFGLFFETLLAAWLCYLPTFEVLGTQPIRFTHWMPGIPWSMMIFVYDETRKYLMRATSPEVTDATTGQVKRSAGWIEKCTYY